MRRVRGGGARPASAAAAVACLAGLLPLLCAGPATASTTTPDLGALVDPMVGTGSGGPVTGTVDTFPGADVPFGMVQWSPDTAPTRPSGGGYSATADQITGFSLTHLSGPGCSIFGDVPVLPTSGAVPRHPETATEGFSHSTETAAPGRYQVSVGSPATAVALSVTTRSGIGSFRFSPGAKANLLFKVSDSASGIHNASVRTVGTDEIEGTVDSGYFCNTLEHYELHFVADFSRPFVSRGTWTDKGLSPGSSSCSGSFQVGCGAWVSFDTTTTPTVMVKVGLSYVSVADAAANLAAEDPGWDLGSVEAKATAAWEKALSRIRVRGGTTDQRRIFYTALYHCLLDPSVFSDNNGRYEGFDGKVHETKRVQYTNFSEWDIYRSEIPLLALIYPHRVSNMMQSLVNDAGQSGWLPVWAVADGDSGTLDGDSADPIIAEAYALGVRGFDVRRALHYMVKGAEQVGTGPNEVSERPNLAAYEKLGYVPATAVNPESATETIGASETLEYALDDSSVSELAHELGETSVARSLGAWAQDWQNLFNPATSSIQAKAEDGAFLAGTAAQIPGPVTQFKGIYQEGFAEGNTAQYTWSVPQDLSALVSLLGGDGAATHQLENFFSFGTNAGPWHTADWAGNEPDLFVPWEYDATGAPWAAQAEVRTIATDDYSLTPGGEPGNDDLGALSSWYVWAALGLYPLTPGSGDLVLASPMFSEATVHLEGKKVLHIVGHGAPDPYVTSATQALGQSPAKALNRPWVGPALVRRGGTLRFVLQASPERSWGAAPADAPPSYRAGAAPAVGFVGSPEVKAAAGATVATTVGAQSATARGLTLDWKASGHSVRVTPSAGRLTLAPVGPADGPTGYASSTVRVKTGRPGRFLVHVTFSVRGRRVRVAPVTFVVDARRP